MTDQDDALGGESDVSYESDELDLLPPPKSRLGTVKHMVKSKRADDDDDDDLDLISTELLFNDSRRKNDEIIKSRLSKVRVTKIDDIRVKVKTELNDNGLDTVIDDGDEELENLIEHGGARFFYFFRDLTFYSPVDDDDVVNQIIDESKYNPSASWETSTNKQFLEDYINILTTSKSKDEPLPDNLDNVDLGIISKDNNKLIVKYRHYNSHADINLLKIAIFLRYNLIYKTNNIMNLFDILLLTLCDANLIRYWYPELIKFSSIFNEVYEKYPIDIESVINRWEIKIYGESEDDIDESFRLHKHEIKNEMWYHILSILNTSATPISLKLTKSFIKFTDLRTFFTSSTTLDLDSLHKRHLDLRLLNYVLIDYDFRDDITLQIDTMKKKYQTLMGEVSFGSASNDVKNKLIQLLHDDYYYLNYYQIKLQHYFQEIKDS